MTMQIQQVNTQIGRGCVSTPNRKPLLAPSPLHILALSRTTGPFGLLWFTPWVDNILLGISGQLSGKFLLMFTQNMLPCHSHPLVPSAAPQNTAWSIFLHDTPSDIWRLLSCLIMIFPSPALPIGPHYANGGELTSRVEIEALSPTIFSSEDVGPSTFSVEIPFCIVPQKIVLYHSDQIWIPFTLLREAKGSLDLLLCLSIKWMRLMEMKSTVLPCRTESGYHSSMRSQRHEVTGWRKDLQNGCSLKGQGHLEILSVRDVSIFLEQGLETCGLRMLLDFNSHHPWPLTMLAGADGKWSTITPGWPQVIHLCSRKWAEVAYWWDEVGHCP